MTRRCAALDFGSNTVGVLFGEPTEDGLVRTWGRDSRFVRLAEGVQQTGRLSDAALARTWPWLEELARRLREEGVDSVRAVATEAVRKAANGAAFCDEVRRHLGTPLELLSGDEEGRLTFRGVRLAIRSGTLALLDIGGGSTELAVGDDAEPTFVHSAPRGAVNLTEEAGPDVDDMVASARAHLPSTRPTTPAEALVVLGGTGLNLASLDIGVPDLSDDDAEGHHVALSRLPELEELVQACPIDERVSRLGIPAGRADVAPAGFALLSVYAAWLGVSTLRVTRHGLRHGLLAAQCAIS